MSEFKSGKELEYVHVVPNLTEKQRVHRRELHEELRRRDAEENVVIFQKSCRVAVCIVHFMDHTSPKGLRDTSA